MATANQIATIVNSINKQALGEKAIEATSVDFVTAGDEVFLSDENVDSFYKALNDVVAKQESTVKPYRTKKDNLYRESFEYGIILQKIYVEAPEAIKNDTWSPVSATPADPYEKFGSSIKVQFFKDFATWDFPQTVPDGQLKTGFLSAQNMGAFIESLVTARLNSITETYENTANLCRCAYIARCTKSTNTNMVVNLLTEYKTRSGITLTPAKALLDKTFLSFASMMISMYKDRFTTASRLFNEKGYKRFSDDISLTVLSDLSNAQTTFAESDTYHKELIALPNYVEVPFWQGPGKDYKFNSTSSVKVKFTEKGNVVEDEDENESDNSDTTETTVEVSNVVAIMCDKQAMGTTLNRQRARSIYNPRGEYNNYYNKAEINYFNDMSENGVIFTLN